MVRTTLPARRRNRPDLLPGWAVGLVLGIAALAGCARLRGEGPPLPTRETIHRGQLVIRSDFLLPANHRLIEDLVALRGDLNEELALPGTDEPIFVYLFEDADRFATFMAHHHPRFPQRRAFFIKTDTRLEVYAQWGDRVAEDLRHETAHGYLHAAVPNVPLWLDEGLAEYYEVPRGQGGVNHEHIEPLAERLDAGWRPDLARLETLPPQIDLSLVDYAESWAWVHFLLTTHPRHRELLREHLRELRERGAAEPLSARLRRRLDDPEAALAAHLRAVAQAHRPLRSGAAHGGPGGTGREPL